MRDRDLSTTHSIMNPQVDRTKPEAEQAAGEVALHKVGETENHITVRGARMLATLAPYADELTIYPGSDIRPQDGRYALSFAVPMATPGLKFICRDSYSKQRDPFDYPLSSRFDEMDAVAIFDDVEVPKSRVFLDGDTVGLLRGDLRHRLARPHHAPGLHARLREALLRASGSPTCWPNTTGVGALRPHPGEARPASANMVELTRSGLVSAEAGSFLDEGGVWSPDDRPFLALPSVLVTFDPHPAEVVRPGSHPAQLTTLRRKAELVEQLGVDAFCVLPFTLGAVQGAGRRVRARGPGGPAARGRRGGRRELHLRAQGAGQRRAAAPRSASGSGSPWRAPSWSPCRNRRRQEITFSSTYIRACIDAGDVAAAAAALGRPHRLEGIVVRGDGRGHELGFPTANLSTPRFAAVPADGVYACLVPLLNASRPARR